MSIEYYHFRNKKEGWRLTGMYEKEIIEARGGTTVALEKVIFDEDILIGDKIALNIGVAFCHDDDNYNKKTGRELSFSRMENREFNVDDVFKYPNGDRTLYLSCSDFEVCFQVDKRAIISSVFRL